MKSFMLSLTLGFGLILTPQDLFGADGQVVHLSIGPACCIPYGSGQACTACPTDTSEAGNVICPDSSSIGALCSVGGVQGGTGGGIGFADRIIEFAAGPNDCTYPGDGRTLTSGTITCIEGAKISCRNTQVRTLNGSCSGEGVISGFTGQGEIMGSTGERLNHNPESNRNRALDTIRR